MTRITTIRYDFFYLFSYSDLKNFFFFTLSIGQTWFHHSGNDVVSCLTTKSKNQITMNTQSTQERLLTDFLFICGD